MDTLKLGTYFVGSRHGHRKANQAELASVAGFHGNLAGAHGPSFAAYLGLLCRVVSDVGIIARAGAVIRGGMPETDGTSGVTLQIDWVGLRVDAKLIGR